MKKLVLVLLLAILALSVTGCQLVTGGAYRLASGQTVVGDLAILGGDAALDAGSRVTGSVIMLGGNADANGQIDGDLQVLGGNINLGPSAKVNGAIQQSGGNINGASDAQRVNPGRAIANGWAAFAFAPLLLVLALIMLVVTRSGRPPATVPPPAAVAGSSGDGVPSPLSSSAGPAPSARVTSAGSGSLVLAVILIVFGVVFLLQELFSWDVWAVLWPLLILAAGLFCFAMMALGGKGSAALAIPGAIISMLGLILLVQNAFDLYETWAYAWALLFPTSVGIGHVIEGIWGGRPDLQARGANETRTGVILFLVFGAFFELALNLSGRFNTDLGRFVLPALLILVGIYLLLTRFVSRSGPGPVR